MQGGLAERRGCRVSDGLCSTPLEALRQITGPGYSALAPHKATGMLARRWYPLRMLRAR